MNHLFVSFAAASLIAVASACSSETPAPPPPPNDVTAVAPAPKPPVADVSSSNLPPVPKSDAGTSGGSTAAPLAAPDGQWTWIPIEGAFCSDGSPTGIGVNLSHKSKGLVVFFQGGGACWDDSSCNQVGLASNTSGFGEKEFAADIAKIAPNTPLDRALGDNPMKDDSLIYIPYCTGDIHGGNRVATYGGKPFHHVGFSNVGAALPRIAATFRDADRMIITGVSAGGFGAAYNFWRFKEAFPGGLKSFLIDDSGPPLPPPYASATVTTTWREAWSLKNTLPPGCEGCDARFDAILDHYATKYPEARYALLSYRQDPVISLFYQVPIWDYGTALDTLATTTLKPRAEFHFFYSDGARHVAMLQYTTLTVGTVKLQSWIDAMLTNDPSWTDVTP